MVLVESIIYRNIGQMNLFNVLVIFGWRLVRHFSKFRKPFSAVVRNKGIRLGDKHVYAQVHLVPVNAQKIVVVLLN